MDSPTSAYRGSAENFRLVECLDVHIMEAKDIPFRLNASTSDRKIFCVAKLDSEEVFKSSTAAYSENPFFADHFYKEIPKNFRQLSFYIFDQYPGRIARQIGRVTLRKKDILKYSGLTQWYRVKPPLSRNSEVNGKLCVEVSFDDCPAESKSATKVKIRVLDYSDLSQTAGGNNDLFALVNLQKITGETSETKKIRIRRKFSTASTRSAPSVGEYASFDLVDVLADSNDDPSTSSIGKTSKNVVRISLWNDIGLVSSYFHGEIRINLNENDRQTKLAWYYLKPRANSNDRENSSRRSSGGDLGSIRLKINYTVDHVLPTVCYSELWTNLLDSLTTEPWRCSVAGLLDVLPNTDLEATARYLVKIYLHSEEIKRLIQVLFADQIDLCQDVNTLCRGNSLATKCVTELMKFVGQQYLISSLKPCIDKIFKEEKNCEVDPQRAVGANLDENVQNLIVYTEFALSRILDSNHRCPQILKDVFRVLRDITDRQFPNRTDVQWLVLSSFIIHRFFAAALMSPKLYGLQKDNPSASVLRTLALISKIIQRISNAVVAGRKLIEKEPYMTPILERFTDERHICAFVKFLDRISCTNSDSSISGESVTVLKEGFLTERSLKKNSCLNLNWTTARPRFCCLTESEFIWSKEKAASPLGRMALLEINVIQTAEEEFRNKLVFQLATETSSVYLESAGSVELGEWVAALKKACRRQRLAQQSVCDNGQIYDIVLENHLEAIHTVYLQNIETIRIWKEVGVNSVSTPPNYPDFVRNDSQERKVFSDSLQNILCCAYNLEQNHREALMRHLSRHKYGSKDMPIGDDNYLLLKSRMRSFGGLVSSNNGPRSSDDNNCCVSLKDDDDDEAEHVSR